MTHGVMVALRFLVSSVKVRVLVGQLLYSTIPLLLRDCGFFIPYLHTYCTLKDFLIAKKYNYSNIKHFKK